jgi:ferritin-like protein
LKGNPSEKEVKHLIKEMIKNENNTVTTEVYYCTKRGNVKGLFKIKESVIIFDPLLCFENDKFMNLDDF